MSDCGTNWKLPKERDREIGVLYCPQMDVDGVREIDVRGERWTKVVRCRDCRRFRPQEGKMLSCRFEYGEYGEFVQWRSAEPDGFCAWAVRR